MKPTPAGISGHGLGLEWRTAPGAASGYRPRRQVVPGPAIGPA